MRISNKTDYALRAMVQLASEEQNRPVTAVRIAEAQGIPVTFLIAILNELKHAFLIRSQRGPDGGYFLRRSPGEISLADVIRAVDGPLANVHETSLEDLDYKGPAETLREVWMAVRATLRSVLETVTLADIASGSLPPLVQGLAEEYEQSTRPSSSRKRVPRQKRIQEARRAR